MIIWTRNKNDGGCRSCNADVLLLSFCQLERRKWKAAIKLLLSLHPYFFKVTYLQRKSCQEREKKHEWHLVWRREMEKKAERSNFHLLSLRVFTVSTHFLYISPVSRFTLIQLLPTTYNPPIPRYLCFGLSLPPSFPEGTIQLLKSAILILFFSAGPLIDRWNFGRYYNTQHK